MLENLTVGNFDEKLREAGISAVLIHRCHCEPSADMLTAFTQYSETRTDIKFFVLARQRGIPLLERFNINGYPTILFYVNGQRLTATQYDGFSTYEHMADFLDVFEITNR
jgi:hypothetical protein